MIHAYKLKGKNIILDVASGSVHCTDGVSFEVISFFRDMFSEDELISRFADIYPEDSLRDLFTEIKQLYCEGTLYSHDENKTIFDKSGFADKGVKAVCLNVAHDCNLSCEYCFASKGSYKAKRELMSLETAKKALLFLFKNSGARKELEVDFFGGEPLLNFNVVKDTVLFGEELGKSSGKKIKYTITTNGTILNEEIESFINRYMDNLVISIDGRPEVHDASRRYNTKKGSYDTVVKNAKKLLGSRGAEKSRYIRGTFTNRNLDFTKDVMHLYSEGFSEISIEPVVGRGESFHLENADMPAIKTEYEKLADEIDNIRKQGGCINFYHFNANIFRGPCIFKRIAACGAGSEYLAVSPDGGIYPCHQFVGMKEFELGNVGAGILNEKTAGYFKGSNIFSKEDCGKCWAKYSCSGGCHAEAFFSRGDIRKPDPLTCELQKKRIECAIYLETEKI